MSYNQIDDSYKEPAAPSPEQDQERKDVIATTHKINEWFNLRISNGTLEHYPIAVIYSLLTSETESFTHAPITFEHSAIRMTRVWVVNNLIGTRIKAYIDSRNTGKAL